MTYLLAIDPGIRGVGAALFSNGVLIEEDGHLVAAGYVENHDIDGVAYPAAAASLAVLVVAWVCRAQHPGGHEAVFEEDAVVNELVLEWPQTYGGRSSRGDASDLLPLAAVDGALAARFPGAAVSTVTPHQWKGSVPKPKGARGAYIIRERVEARLSDAERARVQWPTAGKLSWDVADALGIGLHYIGRFDRKRGSL